MGQKLTAKQIKPVAGAGLAVAGAAAALGLVAGLGARFGARGLAIAAEPLSGDWQDTLKGEHLEILDLLERAQASRSTATAKRAALFARLKLVLTRHALGEENVLYPLLRQSAADEAAGLVDDHADVKAALYELEQIPVDDPRWAERIRALHQSLATHMQQEETEVFPALRQRLSSEEQSRLTVALRREGRLLC